MEANYINIKSRNGFKLKVEKRRRRKDPFILDQELLKRQISTVQSVPISISADRIQKTQKEYLQNRYWSTSKRGFDIVFSLIVTVFVLSWMYPLLFILIKMESKGPFIFKQKRNGLNQKHFNCLKFRSMEVNDYSESLPTFSGDPRITKTGKFIRKCSIDELPQFINVLKGDMTIVGPRPHMVSETNSFNKLSSHFYKRHLVKPGITGLAQINNCRGKINNINDLKNRLKYDLFYIKNASLKLDLKIIYKTFAIMTFGNLKV